MTLETGRLILRPVEVGDAAAMSRLLANDEAGVAMTERLPWPATEAACRTWLAARRASGEHVFAILLRPGGAFIGCCGLGRRQDRAGMGYWIGAAYRDRGFVTEAARAVLDFARAQGVRTVVSETFADNAASQRVLEKLNFARARSSEKRVASRPGTRSLRRFVLELAD